MGDIKNRAWVEINLNSLEKNFNNLCSIFSNKSYRIIPVLKADAYGHGAIVISKKLLSLGVEYIAVASLEEAIHLRRNDITCNLLVLGYTSPDFFELLFIYNITQCIIDFEYAKKIHDFTKETGHIIRCHIKIDTGMGRLGERWDQIESIKEILRLTKIQVTGIFTHFSSSESTNEDSVDYTLCQKQRFDNIVSQIDNNRLITHTQSSYGVWNYGDLGYDYVRIGILLYGVHSNKNLNIPLSVAPLKPILSLYSTVVLVKLIPKGERIGYDRNFICEKNSQVAVVSIGYGDGIPRDYAQKGGCVLIQGEKFPIVANICMDHLFVDITNAHSNITQGDKVTIIGQDGEEYIFVEQFAEIEGTISNEVLSRIGSRVSRIYI